MRRFGTRLFGYLGLLLAVVWMAAPAVASVWPRNAGSENAPCECCDSRLGIVAGMGCIGCQVAPAEQGTSLKPPIATVMRWPSGKSAAVVGIDLAPADPPPRPFSAG